MSAFLALLLACGEPAPTVPPTPPVRSAPAGDVARPADVAAPADAPARVGLGRAATADEIAAWDIDVDPSGAGLPPGSGTVPQGAELYRTQCAACHGLAGEGGVGPKVIGKEPTTGFGEAWEGHVRTIGNWWPYATTLYDYTYRAMPQTAPGSLTPDQTYALTAYLLAENGAVPADFVADAKTLPAVKMPTTIQFVMDDREQAAEVR